MRTAICSIEALARSHGCKDGGSNASKPGVALKRPVGTNGPFDEESELLTDLDLEKRLARSKAPEAVSTRRAIHKKATAAALAYEKTQLKREADRRKQEAADAKDRKRRELALEQPARHSAVTQTSAKLKLKPGMPSSSPICSSSTRTMLA